MTRSTHARIAGAVFLLYIAVGIGQMVMSPDMPGAEDIAGRLSAMATHATAVRIDMVLGLLTGFFALTLAVTLYGVTRHEDHELAIFVMCCRLCEGVSVIVPLLATRGLLWLATDATDLAGAHALAGFLVNIQRWNVILAATFFAVGSTVFTWLLLRGRMIPRALAWLGVVASVLLVIGLPLQLAGVLTGSNAMLMWIPMAAFEIPLGLWLIVRGVDENIAAENARG
jgi:hypothetical protein